jgi:hypothetical protein
MGRPTATDRPTDRIARPSTARRATTALARAPKNDRVDDGSTTRDR